MRERGLVPVTGGGSSLVLPSALECLEPDAQVNTAEPPLDIVGAMVGSCQAMLRTSRSWRGNQGGPHTVTSAQIGKVKPVLLSWEPGQAAATTHDPASGSVFFEGSLARKPDAGAEIVPDRGTSPAVVYELQHLDRERFLARARQREQEVQLLEVFAEWLAELCLWQSFSTLTFAPVRRQHAVAKLLKENGIEPLDDTRAPGRPQDKTDFTAKVFRRWLGILNRCLFGRAAVRGGSTVKFFSAWELQKWGALHCHLLISGMPSTWRYRDIWECWHQALASFGLERGRVDVQPYSPGTVTTYVAKYVSKDIMGDQWSLHGFGNGHARTERVGFSGRAGRTKSVVQHLLES